MSESVNPDRGCAEKAGQQISVRPMQPSDIAAVKAVIDATGLFPSELLDEMIAPYLRDQDGDERWLVCVDDDPVGVAYYLPERMTEGAWNLLLIAVRPDDQGRGCGRALMRYIEADLCRRGARLLLVETSGDAAFEGTRAFYLGLGYDQEARIREFYRAGEDEIVFRKALALPV